MKYSGGGGGSYISIHLFYLLVMVEMFLMDLYEE